MPMIGAPGAGPIGVHGSDSCDAVIGVDVGRDIAGLADRETEKV